MPCGPGQTLSADGQQCCTVLPLVAKLCTPVLSQATLDYAATHPMPFCTVDGKPQSLPAYGNPGGPCWPTDCDGKPAFDMAVVTGGPVKNKNNTAGGPWDSTSWPRTNGVALPSGGGTIYRPPCTAIESGPPSGFENFAKSLADVGGAGAKAAVGAVPGLGIAAKAIEGATGLGASGTQPSTGMKTAAGLGSALGSCSTCVGSVCLPCLAIGGILIAAGIVGLVLVLS